MDKFYKGLLTETKISLLIFNPNKLVSMKHDGANYVYLKVQKTNIII